MSERDWRALLIAAAVRDHETRARLAAEGVLGDGYQPQMEAVHLENAALLDQYFDAFGWPSRARFGDDGAGAAFMILQHDISRPELQRKGLALLLDAIAQGDANPLDAAYLSDRIAMHEGRGQIFGTQFDWIAGEMSPAPIEDPNNVDERRASVGLGPLAEAVAGMRAKIAAAGEKPPPDLKQRRENYAAWARRVGWRA